MLELELFLNDLFTKIKTVEYLTNSLSMSKIWPQKQNQESLPRALSK